MVVVNGWQLFAHPQFLDQLDRLAAAVERERGKNPDGFKSGANFRLLAALRKLVFETVPEDPARVEYRQGGTLGAARKHWFRVKFGGQRFRLFFRFGSKAKIVIYAWVNDSQTLRTYGSATDAYAVFRRMLDDGDPPDDWPTLLGAASRMQATRRLAAAAGTDDAPKQNKSCKPSVDGRRRKKT